MTEVKRAAKGDAKRRPVPIITYHSIDDSGSVVSTSPAIFRRQMAQLGDAGYRTVTVGQMIESITSGEWPDAKTVVLTFDDGFENFLTTAAPILRDHSFSATVYLVTEQCGQFNDWAGNPPELPRSRLLSWSQIKELSSEGFEFGSHTMTHPDLTRVDPDRIDAEISVSKSVIEDAIGRKVASFAYPFGRMTTSVKRLVEAHYTSATSTNLGKMSGRSDLYSLERIDAYYLSNPRTLGQLETAWMDAYLAVRQALRRVKAATAAGR